MEGLNYHHLLYFRMVAREGSIARAAAVLNVSQPTISEQIRSLEKQLATQLFARNGRRLSLTDSGQVALRYADGIHALGDDMLGIFRGETETRRSVIRLGVMQGLTSSTVSHVVSMLASETTQCVVRVASSDSLREEFKSGTLDLVLTSGNSERASSSATASIGIFGTPQLVRKYKARFPVSLRDAPLLVTESTSRLIEAWLAGKKVKARVLVESADSAAVEALARDGHGLAVLAGRTPQALSQLASLDQLSVKLQLLASAKHATTAKKIAGHLARGLR